MEQGSFWRRVLAARHEVEGLGWCTRIPKGVCMEFIIRHDVFLEFIRYSVGSGKRVSFWRNEWVEEGILSLCFPEILPLLTIRMPLLRSSCWTLKETWCGVWS